MSHPADDRPPTGPIASSHPPKLTRRELLKAGTLGSVGLAAATGALALPAWRRLGAQDPAGALHDSAGHAPAGATGHVSHDQMNTVGDLAADSYNPTRFLTDFDSGRISVLPGGQILREYDMVAEDRNIEVAPGVFFAAWAYNG